MENLSALLALTVAVSIDGLAAGFSYGLKKVRLGHWSLVIVAASSGFLLFLFLVAGYAVGSWFNADVGDWLGSLLLIALGLIGIWEAFSRQFDERHSLEAADEPTTIWQLKVDRLGLIIQILRDPQQADLDDSGNISPGEALFLGLALGLDAAGVGLSLGLSGLSSLWFPMVVAGANLGFIATGQLLGELIHKKSYPGLFLYLPGVILIIVGLSMLL